MNYMLIGGLIGKMLSIEAVFMLFPLGISFLYGGDDKLAFLSAIGILALVGGTLSRLKSSDKNFKLKDAFAAATFSWVSYSLFGALPFYFSGHFPNFVDCLFESVSGFTTAGSTVLSNVELMPKGILFWRSFTHWIGGMGVIVLILALMPGMNASSVNLLRAESTGPAPGRFVPRIRETAKVMYLIYISLTALLIILLLFAGMPLFDTFIHAFSTAGTGGFSSMSISIAAYNNAIAEIIITVFMFLFGISFLLYFYLIKGNFKLFLKDEELRFFIASVTVAIIIIAVNIYDIYGSVAEAMRYAAFQAVSIVTTTGFSTANFDAWPTVSKAVLVLLMMTGCCAGSTGGGIKMVRVLILLKAVKVELKRVVHPKSIHTVTLNGKSADNTMIINVALYLFVYFAVYIVSMIIISIEGKDLVSTSTEVISSLSNVGPGLGLVGPLGNYSTFSPLSKLVLCFCMIAGRLEFFPVLALFNLQVWKKNG